MYKLFLIDSNCTIENSFSFNTLEKTYLNEIAKILGRSLKDVELFRKEFYDKYGNFVWEYHEIFWRSIANHFGFSNDEHLIDSLYSIFLDYYEENIELFEDTLKSLKELKLLAPIVMVANGNSKRIRKLINKFNLNSIFDDYVISSETPYKKPDRFMFEFALKKYDCSPCETLMIGDRYDNDIVGANSCGINTALIIHDKAVCLKDEYIIGTNYIGYSLTEIVNMIKKD